MDNEAIDDAGLSTKKVICWASPGCSAQCGLLVQVNEGQIIGMRGNPEFPSNRGMVCRERFPHLVKWLNHPDQLMYPLKRCGERGEDKWERISWEQALDEIADKLKKIKAQYGPESLAVTEGTYRSDDYGTRARFLNLFGNPSNVGAPGTVCGCCREILCIAMAGSNMLPIQAGKGVGKSPSCIVFCGSNQPDARPVAWRQLIRRFRKDHKPKVIVIDSRRTKINDIADMWLQIRPGTDAALFLSWINVIIEENLYDKGFVDQWTFGFEQLKQRASEYTPDRVAEITWIPPEKIRESARLYATHSPASIYLGVATDQIGLNALRVAQAKLCLHAITGNIRPDTGTGETAIGPGPIIDGKMGIRDAMLQLEGKCTQEQRKKQLGHDRFKLMTWPAYEIVSKIYQDVYGIPLYMSSHMTSSPQPLIWRSILTGEPYATKAMITWTSNPLVNAANTKLVYKALKSSNLELHIVLEHIMTPTAMLADYVLPVASKLERPVLSTFEDFSSGFRAGEGAIEPMGERRPDYEFFREIAIRLGYGEYFPWKSKEELNNYRLEPLGMTFKDAARERYHINSSEPWTFETINPKTGKPTGFATPSGKFELYSNVLEELGYDPLPFYEEPPESPVRTPDVAKEFPLILTTGGRFLPQFHSEHRQLGMGMREQHPDPLVEIHPDTAGDLGIADGDWIYIETRRGVIKQKAKVTDGIHPQVVNAEACWWFPEQPRQEPWLSGVWQSNVNVLTLDEPDACDPLTGGWALRALLCRVYKVQTP